jgi:hypothetical protein
MSRLNPLGLSSLRGSLRHVRHIHPAPTEYVVRQRPMQRLLAFSRRTLDEVVNSSAAKNEVLGYFKLHKHLLRRNEIRDLERQWNGG